MPRFVTIKNVRTIAPEDYQARGLALVGSFVGGQSSEVTVEVPCDVDRTVLEEFGNAWRCERVTMFGVAQSMPNAEIARECNVKIVGDHLCGNHYDNTKDITILVEDTSNLRLIGAYCKAWKSVSPGNATKARERESETVVLMLQVVLPPGTELTEADKQRILKLYLGLAGERTMKCSGAGTKKAKPTKWRGMKSKAQTSVYTFYVKCAKEKAASYLDLNSPLLDATPFTTVKGGVVYLNTIQLCNKPAVYNNGSQYFVQVSRRQHEASKQMLGSESSSSSGSSDSDVESEPSSETLSSVASAQRTPRGYHYDPYGFEETKIDVF